MEYFTNAEEEMVYRKQTGEKGQNELKVPPRQREDIKVMRTRTAAREL